MIEGFQFKGSSRRGLRVDTVECRSVDGCPVRFPRGRRSVHTHPTPVPPTRVYFYPGFTLSIKPVLHFVGVGSWVSTLVDGVGERRGGPTRTSVREGRIRVGVDRVLGFSSPVRGIGGFSKRVGVFLQSGQSPF